MELKAFEAEYLKSKDLSNFQDYEVQHKSSSHVYIADSLSELQETL